MDYKISHLTENSDGTVTVVQRIYNGEVTTENEDVKDGLEMVSQPVTRYRRTGLLEEVEYVLEV